MERFPSNTKGLVPSLKLDPIYSRRLTKELSELSESLEHPGASLELTSATQHSLLTQVKHSSNLSFLIVLRLRLSFVFYVETRDGAICNIFSK